MSSAPAPRLISDRLTHWATELADRPALRFQGQERTWREWNDHLERLAGALGGLGITRGKVVATYDKNHPSCLDLTLAAGAIGAAHAIANWRLSAEEVAYVLNDSGAEVVFVGAEFVKVLDSVRDSLPKVREVVIVGTDGGYSDQLEALLASATPAPLRGGEPDDTLLVLYTSGTTGFPKGAMLTHANLIAHSEALAPEFAAGHDDRYLLAMPLFHVGGIAYAFFGIRAGVPTFLTREPEAATLIGAVKAGATHAFLVPPVIARFLDAGEAATGAGIGAAP